MVILHMFHNISGSLRAASRARLAIIGGLIFQIMSLRLLWNHHSTPAVILGRYSPPYALAIVFCAVAALLWCMVLVWHKQAHSILRQFPPLIAEALSAVLAVVAILVWLLPFDPKLIHWVGGTFICLAALILSEHITPLISERWILLAVIALALLLVPILINALGAREFSPDESIWADVGSSVFVDGGLHRRTMGDESRVNPGIGWINAIYGMLLNISFDLRTGRLMRFIMMILSILALAGTGWRYFGRRAAFTTFALAVCGSSIFQIVDYRPDHFVMLGQALSFLAVGYAFQDGRHSQLWHFCAGLAATLSLQLHAVAIVYAFGLSMVYLSVLIRDYLQAGKITFQPMKRFLAYTSGAALGTGIYFFANVMPVGGPGPYLQMLIMDRGDTVREFKYLSGSSPMQIVLYWGGLLLMLLRHSKHDMIYISLLGYSLLGAFLFDTQGYYLPYLGMFIVSGGALLAAILNPSTEETAWSRPQGLMVLGILAALATPIVLRSIDWKIVSLTLQSRQLPAQRIMQPTTEAAAFVQEGEVVVGINEFIWGLQDNPEFYNTMVEKNALRPSEWGEGIAVWYYIDPDVILDIPQRLPLTDELKRYIELEDFITCETIYSAGYEVKILRRVC